MWFVMLRCQDGKQTPMIEGELDAERVAMFPTEEQAWAAGKVNPYGKAFGYEVYEWE